jgi:two-component system cell cycle response regulator DivK
MLLTDKRIFLVEDDQGNASIIQMLLEQEGAKVFRGRWGGEGTIALLRKYSPIDIILLDLMLPGGITGYDVFDDIRAIPEMRSIPIVAVSASDPSMAITKVRAKGFAGFIAKPVDFENFAKQVADILDGVAVWNIGRIMEE